MTARRTLRGMIWDNYRAEEKDAALNEYRTAILKEAADTLYDRLGHFVAGDAIHELHLMAEENP